MHKNNRDMTIYILMTYFISQLSVVFLVYPSEVIQTTTQGHWLVILMGTCLHLVLLFLLSRGLEQVAPHNLLESFSSISRLWTFPMISALILFYLLIMVIGVRAYADLTTVILLNNTPTLVMTLLLILPSLYLGSGSMNSILRSTFLVAIIFLPTIVLISILSFQHVEFGNAMPWQVNDWQFLRSNSFFLSLYMLSTAILFLGFIPSGTPYGSRKLFWCSALGLPIFFLSVYIPLLVFSYESSHLFLFPYVEALDTVDVQWSVFEHVTIFFILNMIIFNCVFLSLGFYIIRKSFEFLLPISTNTSKWMICIFALLIFVSSLLVPNTETVYVLIRWSTPLHVFVLTTIPITIYIIGRRRGRNNESTF